MNAPQKMQQGANDPDIVWRFLRGGQPVPLADFYELEIYPLNSASIRISTDQDGLKKEPDTGRLRWSPTIEQAKGISKGEGVYKLFGTTFFTENGVQKARRRLWAGGQFLVED